MKQIKIQLCLAVLVLAMLACNAANGISAAQTQLPAMMTAAPTTLGPLETAAAKVTPAAVLTALPLTGNTPIPGTLGLSLSDIKLVLLTTKQFSFSDGSLNGKPAAVAKLTATAASTFPVMSDNFAAYFVGDQSNLTEIKLMLPRTNDQATVEQGTGLVSAIFIGILPPDAQLVFLPWVAENYSALAVNSSKEMVSGYYKFVLSRDDSNMYLDMTPAK